LSPNEFRALQFVMIAEAQGIPLTAGELRRQMGLSGAAITYLVERMTETGHLRRETDPSLETSHRTFAALTEAMRVYRAELPVNPG
jgi:DNA-binding MarR family transcriptional regulator